MALLANMLVSLLASWGLFLVSLVLLVTGIACLMSPEGQLRQMEKKRSDLFEGLPRRDMQLLISTMGWLFLITGIVVAVAAVLTP